VEFIVLPAEMTQVVQNLGFSSEVIQFWGIDLETVVFIYKHLESVVDY